MAEKIAEKKATQEQIVRFMETNLNGNKPVQSAIRGIKGVSFMLSNAVAKASGLGEKKLGDLTDEERKKLEDIIMNPANYNIPVWFCNRRNEPATGENRHLTVSTLDLAKKMDINELKRIKCYRGVRHAAGLPVRGQRTRGSFRTGKTVGVSKKKAKGGK